MHVASLTFLREKYPAADSYPFSLDVFRKTGGLTFAAPVTIFAGENGSGKSTLLKAIARKAGIHIWSGIERQRPHYNEFENELCNYIELGWTDEPVPGSFFASEIFINFAQNVDEWASLSPGTLDLCGGRPLTSQSHGQCHMSYFSNRYRKRGLHLLDEPENALSPRRQLELVRIIRECASAGDSQFIIATHSPIIMACPGSVIYSFDRIPIAPILYEETDHYMLYKSFMNDRKSYLP